MRASASRSRPLRQAKPGKVRVYASHQDPRDDVAWESDRIAYRIYGQGLWKVDSLLSSGLDMWVKRVRMPIVEKWYAKGHDEYHRDTGEGADFFDVGQTLGAGGTAIWKRREDVSRLELQGVERHRQRSGARDLRAAVSAVGRGEAPRVTETKRVAIDAGQNLNHVTSIFRAERRCHRHSVGDRNRQAPNVVGSESKARPWAWLSVWGPLLPKDGGHGDLGIGMLIPRDAVLEWKETNDHYLPISRAKSGQPVNY